MVRSMVWYPVPQPCSTAHDPTGPGRPDPSPHPQKSLPACSPLPPPPRCAPTSAARGRRRDRSKGPRGEAIHGMGFIAANREALIKVGGAFLLFQMAGQSLKARQEREAIREALQVCAAAARARRKDCEAERAERVGVERLTRTAAPCAGIDGEWAPGGEQNAEGSHRSSEERPVVAGTRSSGESGSHVRCCGPDHTRWGCEGDRHRAGEQKAGR